MGGGSECAGAATALVEATARFSAAYAGLHRFERCWYKVGAVEPALSDFWVFALTTMEVAENGGNSSNRYIYAESECSCYGSGRSRPGGVGGFPGDGDAWCRQLHG